MNKRTIDNMRLRFPRGCRVELVRMDDPQAPPIGTKGTVIGVDDIGTILVDWDNGSGLGVAFGADACRRIGERAEALEKLKELRKAKMQEINTIPETITDEEWDRRYTEICERYDAQEKQIQNLIG